MGYSKLSKQSKFLILLKKEFSMTVELNNFTGPSMCAHRFKEQFWNQCFASLNSICMCFVYIILEMMHKTLDLTVLDPKAILWKAQTLSWGSKVSKNQSWHLWWTTGGCQKWATGFLSMGPTLAKRRWQKVYHPLVHCYLRCSWKAMETTDLLGHFT